MRYASKTSYYLLFKSATFSYYKPSRIYERRDEAAVKQWKNTTKPRLNTAWNDEETIILAADEMVLSTQTTVQKVWLAQGDYPKIEVSNKRQNRSVYGFLNLKTGRVHAFKTLKQNMVEMVACLKALRACYRHKKILLLWDTVPVGTKGPR